MSSNERPRAASNERPREAGRGPGGAGAESEAEVPNERVREADRAPREARGESEAGVPNERARVRAEPPRSGGESEAGVSVSGEIHPQAARLPGARGTLLRLASEFREYGNNVAQDIHLVLESEAGWKWAAFEKDTRISKLKSAVRKLITAVIDLDNGYYRCPVCKNRWDRNSPPYHASDCLLLDVEVVMTTAFVARRGDSPEVVKSIDMRSGYPRDLIESLSKNAAYGKEDSPVSVPAYTSEEISAAPPERRQYMAFAKRAAPLTTSVSAEPPTSVPAQRGLERGGSLSSDGPDDPVNHPRHYTSSPSGVECIDIIEHMTLNLGNATKYIWRAGQKNDLIEDLRKAAWYVAREISRVSKLRAKEGKK